ncbi:hypothetical protein R1sor_024076 [Riccia sorocarpa]|uniref:Uncharacterized protein n=1 Tax=Riccia sorocarpa TaxID=122646 RepID=A0ABD3GPG1_9MARC
MAKDNMEHKKGEEEEKEEEEEEGGEEEEEEEEVAWLFMTYGISPLKRLDDESYKCTIGRLSLIQATISIRNTSLEEFLEHHDIIVITPQELLAQADGGQWSSARLVDVQSSGLYKSGQFIGEKSQKLRELAFISGNFKDESIISGGGDSSPLLSSKGETFTAALRQCVSLGGGRRCKKMVKPWKGRLKSRSASYLELFKDLPGTGPTVFSTLALYDKHSPEKQVNRYGKPPSGFQDVAWLSLDGRLMNADTATSLNRIGGPLGGLEACVWEGLNPLQRVLIVAVAAAAAAAAKAKSTREAARLQSAINEREVALLHMRQELKNLSSEVDKQRTQLNNTVLPQPSPERAAVELNSLLSKVDVRRSHPSPQLSEEPDYYAAVNQFCESLGEFSELNDEIIRSPAVNRQLDFSNVMKKKVSPLKEESPIAGGPGLELMEKMILSNGWIESLDLGLLLEETAADEDQEQGFGVDLVRKDVVFEGSGKGKESTKQSVEAGEADIKADLQCHLGACSRFEPVTETGFGHEWLSETSSVIMDPFSPQPLEKKRQEPPEVDTSKEWSLKSEGGDNSFSSRARCASIILDVKKQVISLLDEAASNMLEALNYISEKAGLIGVDETAALTPQKPEDVLKHRSPDSDAIKENVSNVAARIASLQTAMVNVWQTLGPEAMAALDISPSDFDDYLTNLQIAKILNDDATELSVASIQSESWQDWFRRGFDNPERSFLRRIQATGHDEGLENASCNIDEQTAASEWPPSVDVRTCKTSIPDSDLVTPTAPAPTSREKVEKLMSPLYERSESTTSSDSPSNLATVAEQLVAELEKSAAKVAAMEVQLKNLKKYVKACDLKRKQVERKLLEAWEQDSKNQVKAGAEIMELQRQVHLKEAAYQELIRSRKALVAAKVQEINELKEDCRRREQALKDMSAQAQATNEASEKKLAVLEEICRKKDNTILTLKQEIFELEGKVQELQACQTPAQLRPMNLPPERAIGDDSDELVVNERGYRLFGADDAQVRSSFTSMCESETRRTSWGSDLSAQEFHIIDTPWSSELCADQDFNVIEEAAFQGRSLSIFQNVTSSQEFSRGVMRKFRDGGFGPASCGSSSGMDSSATSSKQSGESTDSQSRDMKKVNSIIPSSRRELSRSVATMVTTRPNKKRDEAVRSSVGVLSTVGINTPIKPKQRSSSVSKERASSRSSHSSSHPHHPPPNGGKTKENSSTSNRGARQKWV